MTTRGAQPATLSAENTEVTADAENDTNNSINTLTHQNLRSMAGTTGRRIGPGVMCIAGVIFPGFPGYFEDGFTIYDFTRM